MTRKNRPLDRIAFEHRVLLMAMAVALPSTATAIALVFVYSESDQLKWTVTILLSLFCLAMAAAVREKVVFPLRTISNLLAALHEGDFSFRARPTHHDDALSEVMIQLNAIVDTLRDQRSSALEATALLRKVMSEIDVAIFAFDAHRMLKLINRAGEKLIGKAAERVMGLQAADLGLDEFLTETATTSVRSSFPGASGVWGIRRGEFRERGAPHSLLVIADLTRPLREEELVAWQRLVRVLGHEINNSLTPVKSISESLGKLVMTEPLPEDWREDTTRGLEIISSRAEALNRFTGTYARLARHPAPVMQPMPVRAWIVRTVALETRLNVSVQPGEDVVIPGDPDQLDQLLINILRNAVDATLEAGGKQVSVDWKLSAGNVMVSVIDEGLGIANAANLFVPFFTTKPKGSGIGLVLSRQIAEAHGGSLTLTNRTDRAGAVALLTLPRRNPI
jgi:two-component system nitrogen regulation sensor histidine kinase NtrY